MFVLLKTLTRNENDCICNFLAINLFNGNFPRSCGEVIPLLQTGLSNGNEQR